MPSSMLYDVTEQSEVESPVRIINTSGVDATAGASAEEYPALEARVLACLESADFGEALCLLEAALMVRETAVLWNDWATVQFHSGDASKAERGYRRGLAIDPDCRDAAVNLGVLLLKTGRNDEAKPMLAKYQASLSAHEQQALAAADHVEKQDSKEDLQAQVERLEKAIQYLLLKQVNAKPSGPMGQGSYDALVGSFLKLILAVQPKHFFDIGANNASTALRIKQLLPLCKVWAFEANPKIHAKFLPSVVSAGVRYVNAAVSGSTGQVTLYMPRTYTKALIHGEIIHQPAVEPVDTGRSSVLKRNEDATYEEFTVPSVTLDDLFQVQELVDEIRDVVLWVDVEGAAFEVLSAAGAALKKTAILFVESENHAFWTGQKDCADVAGILLEAGFIPLERDREYGDKQFNTIFVHHSLLHLVYPTTFLTNEPAAPIVAPEVPSAPAARKRFKSYTSIAAHMTASIPMIIPTFNNPSYTENMLRQLVDRGFDNICVVDNGSSSAAMLALLEKAEGYATVIRSGQNHGPRHTLLNLDHYNLLPEIFCVTDPDLEFNPQMPENFVSELVRVTEHFKIGKAGLALRIDDTEKMHGGKFFIQGREYEVPEWEKQWWKDLVGQLPDGSPIYRAVTDTTFAIYNKKYFTPNLFFDSVRIAGNYTCRHLPWYKDSGLGSAEDQFYRSTQQWSYHLSVPGKVSKAERGF